MTWSPKPPGFSVGAPRMELNPTSQSSICADCVHAVRPERNPEDYYAWKCNAFDRVQVSPEQRHPITGERFAAVERAARCKDHNANGDCESFSRKAGSVPAKAATIGELPPSKLGSPPPPPAPREAPQSQRGGFLAWLFKHEQDNS